MVELLGKDIMRITKRRKNLYNIKRDGITQSLILMFLTCREKAKLYLQGWERDSANQAITDGSVGHEILELAYRRNKFPSVKRVRKYVSVVEKRWRKEKPNMKTIESDCLEYSLAMNEAILPVYFKHHKSDFKKIKWLGLEEEFQVPIILKDGRKIILRGKKDGKFNREGLWLFETKFKSLINTGDLVDTLPYETQVLFYLWAEYKQNKTIPQGVLYNIVRRTSLRMKKGESIKKFAKRVGLDAEARPGFYFIRLEVDISEKDLLAFGKEIEGLIKDYYDWTEKKVPHYKNTYACIGKYGRCEYIPACSRNEFDHLRKRKVPFNELQKESKCLLKRKRN